MTDVDIETVRAVARRLRELADLIEQHPPHTIEADFRRPHPIETDGGNGFIEYIPREGFEAVDIAIRW